MKLFKGLLLALLISIAGQADASIYRVTGDVSALNLPVNAQYGPFSLEGSFPRTIALMDSSAFSQFFQGFTTGNALRFDLDRTHNLNAIPTSELFAVAISDNSLVGIPTTGLGDSLLLVNIDSTTPTAQTSTADCTEATVMTFTRSGKVPEPATIAIWGLGSLALAAATYRRQKRAGRRSKRVQAAVTSYLQSCEGAHDHFRRLSCQLTTLADDPTWTKPEIEEFYDEVVIAIHNQREKAAVA